MSYGLRITGERVEALLHTVDYRQETRRLDRESLDYRMETWRFEY